MPEQPLKITTKKKLTIGGKTFEPGDVLGSVTVPDGVPVERVLASLRNGCAVLGDEPKREGDKKPKQ